jgi:serine/threonine-protein kinase RsbW
VLNDGVESSDSDEGLLSSRPPEGLALVRVWELDTVQEIALIRAGLRRELARGAEPQPRLDPIAENMVLVASELATNALRHGKPPTVVQLFHSHDTYVLDVADHDLNSAPCIAGAREPGHGGFGLQIARRLAQTVAWYTSDTTKHVWAQFPAATLAT